MSDEELSREEQEALRALKRDEFPPSRIERAVISALKRDGTIAARRRWVPIASVAAAVLAFAAGLSVPRSPAGSAPAAEPRFAILLYRGAMPPGAPRRRDEYAAWARQVASSGTPISGEELADDAEDPSGPRGFFIIGAPSAARAREIAATCPHARYGGRVVVRSIAARP